MCERRGRAWLAAGMLLLTAAMLLHFHNLSQENRGCRASARALVQVQRAVAERSNEAGAQTADGFPMREMPAVFVGDTAYLGTLEIPAVCLSVPIHAQCSDALLRDAPCRYAGSAYQGNFVIAGHNYSSHFGVLSALRPGDAVCFTDADGSRFSYTVAYLETLAPAQVTEMTQSGCALTLFTCTYGGGARIAVRCNPG